MNSKLYAVLIQFKVNLLKNPLQCLLSTLCGLLSYQLKRDLIICEKYFFLVLISIDDRSYINVKTPIFLSKL